MEKISEASYLALHFDRLRVLRRLILADSLIPQNPLLLWLLLLADSPVPQELVLLLPRPLHLLLVLPLLMRLLLLADSPVPQDLVLLLPRPLHLLLVLLLLLLLLLLIGLLPHSFLLSRLQPLQIL